MKNPTNTLLKLSMVILFLLLNFTAFCQQQTSYKVQFIALSTNQKQFPDVNNISNYTVEYSSEVNLYRYVTEPSLKDEAAANDLLSNIKGMGYADAFIREYDMNDRQSVLSSSNLISNAPDSANQKENDAAESSSTENVMPDKEGEVIAELGEEKMENTKIESEAIDSAAMETMKGTADEKMEIEESMTTAIEENKSNASLSDSENLIEETIEEAETTEEVSMEEVSMEEVAEDLIEEEVLSEEIKTEGVEIEGEQLENNEVVSEEIINEEILSDEKLVEEVISEEVINEELIEEELTESSNADPDENDLNNLEETVETENAESTEEESNVQNVYLENENSIREISDEAEISDDEESNEVFVTLKGNIYDYANDKPLKDVIISVDGKSPGTATDKYGDFQIDVSEANYGDELVVLKLDYLAFKLPIHKAINNFGPLPMVTEKQSQRKSIGYKDYFENIEKDENGYYPSDIKAYKKTIGPSFADLILGFDAK